MQNTVIQVKGLQKSYKQLHTGRYSHIPTIKPHTEISYYCNTVSRAQVQKGSTFKVGSILRIILTDEIYLFFL